MDGQLASAGRLSVLITAPYLDGSDVGESHVAFKLLEAMCPHADLTVLAFECLHGPPLARQLPGAEVVTWPEPAWMRRRERLRGLMKPHLFVLNRHVDRWLRRALGRGRRFDLAHQLLPSAARYSTPLRRLPIPYVIGPVGGSLATPAAFRAEARTERWYTRLRQLDQPRFRHDPFLRASYGGAALVLGVAPYMAEVLSPLPIRRFEPFLGIGVDDLAPEVDRAPVPGRLRLLHVGRAVRTKGLRDAVRAMAHLADLPGVTLTAIGGGEEEAVARAEARALGVGDRVAFLGRLPREEIEAHYRAADVLVFPSFRESMGGVLYEAMRWGLPVITTDRGGPGFIVDDRCGVRLPVDTPEALARDIAGAVRALHDDPERRLAMGRAARERVAADALWTVKAEKMLALYRDVLRR